MRTYLDCYPCVLRQAIEAARMAGATPEQEKKIVWKTLDILKSMPEGETPPAIGARVHQVVRQVSGSADPYHTKKQEATEKALSMLPKLRSLLDASEDRLETAIRLSIAGNIIDFGPNKAYDLWEVVKRVLEQDFAINALPNLRKRLAAVDSVLFLGDNAGESVFDLLLIETLSKPVTYVVRGGPVLNDVTIEDARAAGIDHAADVIDNGAEVPGTILTECSPEFVERFKAADLILAKGMGNYETLSTEKAPIFFMMQVKCPVIGMDIGAPAGSIVLQEGRTS